MDFAEVERLAGFAHRGRAPGTFGLTDSRELGREHIVLMGSGRTVGLSDLERTEGL